MPSRILLAPFISAALVVLYFMLIHKQRNLIYVLLPLLCCVAVIYVLSPQINWWWFKRKPKRLSPGLKKFMEANLNFYDALSEEAKYRFDSRMSLSMLSYDFKPMGFEQMPEDIKAIILANSIRLTFGLPDYLFKQFENIVVYPHPFPSPQYPDDLHASELYQEDGVMIFSAEQVMQHIFNPTLIFNVVLYEWVRVLMSDFRELAQIPVTDEHWPAVSLISGIPKEKVMATIGLKDIDPRAVAIVYFFTYPERFEQGLPETYKSISEILNQNPSSRIQPILNITEAGKDF